MEKNFEMKTIADFLRLRKEKISGFFKISFCLPILQDDIQLKVE